MKRAHIVRATSRGTTVFVGPVDAALALELVTIESARPVARVVLAPAHSNMLHEPAAGAGAYGERQQADDGKSRHDIEIGSAWVDTSGDAHG